MEVKKMNDPQAIPELLTTKELLRLLKVTSRSLRRWVADGRFPQPIFPGRWRRDDVAKILNRTNEDECGQMRTSG